MKWVVLAFCLIVTGAASAQNCVVEGAWMGIGPQALQNCCAGLEINPPPPGQIGSRGQCLKKQSGQFCIGENLPILNYPGAVNKCCSGLTQMPNSIPDNRIVGNCVNIPACVAEGQAMTMNPGYRRPCCNGLVHQLPTSGRMGDAGTCVKPNAVVETNCVMEGGPLFVYPGAPNCCRGLSGRRPNAQSPIGFAEVCMRGPAQVQVNDSEARKELTGDNNDLGLRDDPGVSNQ
ncbi:MAG: hypothetical protein V4598_19960 [Bdellovibrionota bacterium]